MERAKFHTLIRNPNETVREFIVRLQRQACKCNFEGHFVRIVVPPNLRNSVLQDLHSCHLGVDKMKSLARQTVWWPELKADISAFVSKCNRYLFKKPSVKASSWTPWPLTYMPWQRIHVDYCGPFLRQYYTLILIDSYSKLPEVFLTTKADGAFTKLAMWTTFSREGAPLTVVTDNGTHFTSSEV